MTSEQAAADTPAGSAYSEHYLEFLRRSVQQLSETEYIDILLQGWIRSNDRLRLGNTEELRDPARLEILSQVVSSLQSHAGPNRLRAAEAARQAGNFQLAITLLNHQFEPSVKPFADFLRDLSLLGDVLVRKIAVYPDIVAFEKAKARAVENTAELARAQAEWEKQKNTISARHTGVGAFGCLLLLAGIFGAGMLGLWALLAIPIGILLFLVYLPLSSIASRKAKAWETAHPKPNWSVFSPTFNENPPVLGMQAINISPPARNHGHKAGSEKAVEIRDESTSQSSALVETLQNEWRDPALSEVAQKVKTLIESNSGMLDLFLLETSKSFVVRQSFVKHQIFAYLTIFSIEFKKRHSALLIGYQNQIIREIRASLPLLSYPNQQLIEGFHAFQSILSEMSQQREIKFYFDLAREDPKSAASVPGYLSYVVCEEARMNEDAQFFELLFRLFNCLIESAQKEHAFDQSLDSFIHRISAMN